MFYLKRRLERESSAVGFSSIGLRFGAHTVARGNYSTSSRVFDTLFWLPQTPAIHGAQIKRLKNRVLRERKFKQVAQKCKIINTIS